jgi:hypothetical protein
MNSNPSTAKKNFLIKNLKDRRREKKRTDEKNGIQIIR